MKQEMISYLSTIKEEIFNLSKYLYDNPEEAFKEVKASEYIETLLQKHDFKVTKNYENISTAFMAQFGNDHPRICFICEYDADAHLGHIRGNNLTTSMSVAAALSLAKIIPKSGGSVIVLGCPGEYIHGTKETLIRQGVFEDIDAVLMAHPFTKNMESEKTCALVPIKICFKNSGASILGNYTAFEAGSIFVNTLFMLLKSGTDTYSLQNLSINDSECSFYISAPTMQKACDLRKQLESLSSLIGNITGYTTETSLFEQPCMELITSDTISRLFAHNLKENGIIDICTPEKMVCGSTIGSISHEIPCIHPYVAIVEDASIKFPSKEFGTNTLTPFAQEQVIKAAEALSFTALDLIEKESLLREAKVELSKIVFKQNESCGQAKK